MLASNSFLVKASYKLRNTLFTVYVVDLNDQKDLTKKQAEYNQYAPIFMTSVDTDAELCAKERSAFLQRLGVGKWSIFGGHGQKKEYSPQATK